MNRRCFTLCTFCALVGLLATACARDAESTRPNILWIVWDTVRADHLSLYGHPVETTPNLERWASGARIFDASAASCWTVPSHASMFTGLLPSEHGLNRGRAKLGAKHATLAERLQGNGYQTYAFSANPYVSGRTGLTRGFEIQEYPYDPALIQQARDLVARKTGAEPRTAGLAEGEAAAAQARWDLKAVGPLVNRRFARFLEQRDTRRPFFAFLNYMEAHRVRVPDRSLRERVMSASQVESSYEMDQSQDRMQRVSLGLQAALSEREVEVVNGVYDAALAELDVLLDAVLADLEERGLSEQTIVILTSDHGEHLGDHGSYLHQYSLYDGVLRVPLVVWAPGWLAPGREEIPVTNVDLFATILEFAGLPVPPESTAVSLLRPVRDRALVSQYLPFKPMLKRWSREYPDWNFEPFMARLSAVRVGSFKLLVDWDGKSELYDLSRDPGEVNDLLEKRPELAMGMREQLKRRGEIGRAGRDTAGEGRELGQEEEEQLRALGYL